MGTAAKPTPTNICLSLVINVVLGVFFAKYAFGSPDDGNDCYVYELDGGLEYSPVEVANSTHVGGQFHIIFIGGFVNSLINLIYVAAGVIYIMYKQNALLKCSSGLVCFSGLLSLAVVIYASIVIFGERGQLCHDTLLKKSGQFIYVYTIMVYCSMGLLLCCGCMLCCVLASNKKNAGR